MLSIQTISQLKLMENILICKTHTHSYKLLLKATLIMMKSKESHIKLFSVIPHPFKKLKMINRMVLSQYK